MMTTVSEADVLEGLTRGDKALRDALLERLYFPTLGDPIAYVRHFVGVERAQAAVGTDPGALEDVEDALREAVMEYWRPHLLKDAELLKRTLNVDPRSHVRQGGLMALCQPGPGELDHVIERLCGHKLPRGLSVRANKM
jgi:hypothetical protein